MNLSIQKTPIFFLLLFFTCEKALPQIAGFPHLRDVFGNEWSLNNENNENDPIISVSPPFQKENRITFNKNNGFPAGKWNLMASDMYGFLWVGGNSGLIRFDPRKPENGWKKFTETEHYKNGPVKSMEVSREGLLSVSLASGETYIVDIDKEGNQIAVPAEKISPASRIAPWKSLSPMPYSSHDVFGAELDGKIYIPGGGAPHGYPAAMTNFNRLLIYDTQKDQWEISSPMKINRRYCNLGVLNGKIYVVGGYYKSEGIEHATNTVEIYDPENDTWTDGPTLPVPCSQSVAGVMNDRLIVVFSNKDKSLSNTFSISSDEHVWSEETPPPYPVYQTDGCIYNDKLYILIPAKGLISYDPASGIWMTEYPPIPGANAPRAAAVANYEDRIWIIGGTDVENKKAVWVYTPDVRVWTEGPPFPKTTCWADGIEVNGKLYVFGGAGFSERHGTFMFWNTIYALDPGSNRSQGYHSRMNP